eukprot:5283943-Pleurochrysis_carterae.AAC.13
MKRPFPLQTVLTQVQSLHDFDLYAACRLRAARRHNCLCRPSTHKVAAPVEAKALSLLDDICYFIGICRTLFADVLIQITGYAARQYSIWRYDRSNTPAIGRWNYLYALDSKHAIKLAHANVNRYGR